MAEVTESYAWHAFVAYSPFPLQVEPGDGDAIDWQFDEAAQQWFNPETGEYAPAEADPNAPPVYAGYEDWGYDPATGAHIDPQVTASPRHVRHAVDSTGTG